MGLVTLTFDLLTLKLVCKLHQRWGTFIPNLDTLGLWVLKLLAMYATDGQMDGQADKIKAYCPLPYRKLHKNTAYTCANLGIAHLKQQISEQKCDFSCQNVNMLVMLASPCLAVAE